MPAIISLTGILIFAHLTCIDTFVVTRYDSVTITKYYRYIDEYYMPRRNLSDFFNHQDLVQFCHQLRESRFFDWTNTTDVSSVVINNDVLSSSYTISDEDLELERDQAVLMGYIGLYDNHSERFPLFICLDFSGFLTRAVSPGLVPNTAFLSTYYDLWKKQVNWREEQPTYQSILIGIIDASPVILEAPDFNNFIEVRGGLQRDPLCDLKRLLKFRLCAAASIALGHVEHRYDELHYSNLYYEPENDEESCQSLEGTDQTSRRYPKMLYCTVKLTNSRKFKSYYLSLDVLESNNVLFIRQVWNGSQYKLETQYLYVPLLDQLELYEEIFTDVNI